MNRDGLDATTRHQLEAQEHQARHQELHKYLDELVADWISNTRNLPSNATILELMEWSNKQAAGPDHGP